MTDLISREAAIAAANACPDRYCGSWVAERTRALPAVQPDAVQCCMCGKKGLSTEEDNGPECELSDGRWVCSEDCWNDAPEPSAAAIQEAAFREVLEIARDAMLGFEALQTVATRGGNSKDVLAHSSAREAARQIFAAISALIDKPGKEVMPDDNDSTHPRSDTAPAGLSAGGGAGWQPIETAPKDRVVDLWSKKGFRYTDAFWDVCCGEECWTDPNDHGSIEEGGPYTHWRYPPEPPAEGGAGWQPIETAPRDGSRFLGYWPSSGRDGDVAVTTWWDAFEGFWESPFESADYGADYGPTRWMPHPPATEGI